MKTIEIQVPEGYEIGDVKFKKISEPMSWEELGRLNGHFVSSLSSIGFLKDAPTSSVNRNAFVTKDQAEASLALAQLSQLMKAYRDGWMPDWEDVRQEKWCVRYKTNTALSCVCALVCPSFLSFQSKEVAEKFKDRFRDLIIVAKPLMS